MSEMICVILLMVMWLMILVVVLEFGVSRVLIFVDVDLNGGE